MLRIVPKSQIPSLIDEVREYCDNTRFRKSQFLKYLVSEKNIESNEDSCFLGLFDEDGRCLSLSYLTKIPENFIFVAEIQTIVKGNGKKLIESILSLSRNIWWMSDPNGGESLLNYYRKFNLDEFLTDYHKTIFYKAENEKMSQILRDFVDQHII